MFSRIPFNRVDWPTSSFLIGTLFLSLTAVPAYIWFFGIDWFQIGLFFAMFFACGFSITLGYHRLYSHLTFQAHWIVRLLTLIFGAGAFENSVLLWTCEHRAHHKHVDHDEDPYCISKGFFHAHMGWLMFKLNPLPPFDNVADLQKDPLVMWQYRYIHLIAVSVAFVFPAILGFAWGGWVSALGAFLIAGVARIVVLQHCTFCINSLCHYMGKRPYSSRCSARDWTLSKVGLVSKLRRVPTEKIVLAELAEAQRQLETVLASPGLKDAASAFIRSAYHRRSWRNERPNSSK